MWVAVVGRVLLWLALAAALAAAGCLVAGEQTGRAGLGRAGRAAFWVLAGLVGAAALLLLGALAGGDFHVRYVAEHSSAETPLAYRLGAFWGGQEGSLLLWLSLLCGYGAYLLARPPREGQALLPYALAILAGNAAAFCWLVAAPASPFRPLPTAPADGQGLNRLLHDQSFLIHPVALYLGYVGFAVPYAFAMAGLLRGEAGERWIRLTHRWTLAAWTLLSLGILMGARWSYHVLGWGGYWSFDPVENAALLPWLTGTALLHSAMVQERRGMLKAWNAVLVAATFVLTLFGTFLTRSGIVDSVHTFAQSPIGGQLLALVGLATALSLYVIGSRLELLRDDRPLEAPLSKEGAFLLNNIVFVSLALTVLVGTVLPVVSPYFGQAVSLGPPYFERVTAPLFTVALLLAGVGPLVAWRRAGLRALGRHLLPPLGAAAAFAALLAAAGVGGLGVVVGLGCAAFAAAAVLYDFGLAVAARLRMQPSDPWTAAWRLVARNPRRYGGYLVHLAMAIIASGVVASHALQREYDQVTLRVGETAHLGPLDLTYEGMGAYAGGGAVHAYARLLLSADGRGLGALLPAVSLGSDAETASGTTFEPAIRQGLGRDVYVVLEGYSPGGAEAVFHVYLNPLVTWIWIGGGLLVAGAVFSLWPRREALLAPRSHRVFSLWAELEYDYRMGKLAEADYLALRARYGREAELALAAEAEDLQRDLAGLEARVARRVAELEAQACPAPVGAGRGLA